MGPRIESIRTLKSYQNKSMVEPSHLTVSVLITSFHRTEWLSKCMDSLLAQNRSPDQIVVVARDTDSETQKIVLKYSDLVSDKKIDLVIVKDPGVIAANNAAYPVLNGDVIVFLDDDSTAPSEWLEKLVRHYSDSTVGAVGGRIINYRDGIKFSIDPFFKKYSQKVGLFGQFYAGQCCDFEGIWEVEHLRGCNMSFRRDLLVRCDTNLRGDGFRYEADLCLLVQGTGRRIILDGQAYNYHWCAPRKQGPQRDNHTTIKYNNQYNETYVLAKHRRSIGLYILRQFFYQIPRSAIGSLIRFNPYVFYQLGGTISGFFRGIFAGQRVNNENIEKLRKRSLRSM